MSSCDKNNESNIDISRSQGQRDNFFTSYLLFFFFNFCHNNFLLPIHGVCVRVCACDRVCVCICLCVCESVMSLCCMNVCWYVSLCVIVCVIVCVCVCVVAQLYFSSSLAAHQLGKAILTVFSYSHLSLCLKLGRTKFSIIIYNLSMRLLHCNLENTCYRAFPSFGQAKFAYGGSILSSSQFTLLPQLPPDARFKSGQN